MTKNCLRSYFARYWRLFLLFGFALGAALNDSLFSVLGAVLYLPALLSGAVISALFVRHLFFPNTIDRDAHSGFFVEAWNNDLSPRDRVFLSCFATGLLIYVAGQIASALVR